ncbi:MAG: hypothetical protein ACTSPW_19020 [Promethearchaeota archaeon]
MLVIFSENIKLKNNDLNLKLIKQIHRILNTIINPLFFLILLYSNDLFIFFFGNDYKYSGLILTIFSIKLLIISINYGNEIYFRAIGNTKLICIISVAKNLLNLFFLFIFTLPNCLNLGILGAVLAHVIPDIIMQLIIRPYFYKKYRLGFYWKIFINFSIIIILSFFQQYINRLFETNIILILLTTGFNLIFYFFITYLLKSYRLEDIKLIYNTLKLKNIKKSIGLEFKNQ